MAHSNVINKSDVSDKNVRIQLKYGDGSIPVRLSVDGGHEDPAIPFLFSKTVCDPCQGKRPHGDNST